MSRARVRARIRPSRLRLTAALAVTLAATTAATVAGPGVAAAAPAALTREETAEATLPVLTAQNLAENVGATGFLTVQYYPSYAATWTRYDGTSVQLPADGSRHSGGAESDVVVASKGTRHTVQDMAKGGDPVVIDSPYELRQVNGSTLVMVDKATNALHLVSREPGGQTVDRKVTGLPSGAIESVSSSAPGTIAVQLHTGDASTFRFAVIDAATAAVTRVYDTESRLDPPQVTPDHIAWTTYDSGTKIVDRHTGASETVPGRATLVFGDDWLAVRDSGRFTLRSRKDGHTAELFRSAGQLASGPDGTLLVGGISTAGDWGFFRVALGTDGEPKATLVADVPDGQELTLRSLSIPNGPGTFRWDISDEEAGVRFELTHTATGLTKTLDNEYQPFLYWDGSLRSQYFGAYNGTYTWKMHASSGGDHFGPSVWRTGTFTLARPAQPRDFNDNAGTDALVRDGAGRLLAYETRELTAMRTDLECYETDCQPVRKLTPELLGTGGWNTYDLLTSPGNLAGGAADDIVGRDRDGVLWLYQSEKQKLLPRTKIGGGWQVYNKIIGGSDLNGDGRGDLLATDTSGVLWLYTSTGSATKPFHTRKRIGGGWQTYNLLTAPGNIAGATGGDLLARDKDGVLWLYLGKGDGTFTARRQIGGGWQKYTQIVSAGKNYWNPVNDILAVGPSGSARYMGTNSTTRPFERAIPLPLRTDSTTYKTFF
ncbi:VCBS repeat-containing protein [Streptomyces hydrogenans]|uniref:VCBS repeat-containing protein n=1 Tax=Streptomyces hydrogenans TaxID=1873719 RepID=UPI00278C37C0|nr:VCBS repeat-containing protein [Streptomyces hydrogenans]